MAIHTICMDALMLFFGAWRPSELAIHSKDHVLFDQGIGENAKAVAMLHVCVENAFDTKECVRLGHLAGQCWA